MKIKLAGGSIVISPENTKEQTELRKAMPRGNERVRLVKAYADDKVSATKLPALVLVLEKAKSAECDMDRKHWLAKPISFGQGELSLDK